jgi:hypothetical protein
MYYVVCSLILSHLYYIYVILLCIVRNFTAYYVICALHTASLVLRILRSLYYIWVILLCILRHLCFAYYVICAVHVTGTSEPNYNTEALYKQFKCFFRQYGVLQSMPAIFPHYFEPNFGCLPA